MLKAVLIIVSLFCVVSLVASAQTTSPASTNKTNRLIVYGEGFAFGVKEPDHWRADTGKLADKYQANIAFAPDGDANDNVTLRVRVNSKVDENTVEDLNYDMAGYKKEYPKARFNDLSVRHSEYKTFAKLVFVPDEFYEYVAYVNPGAMSKFTLSVGMSKKSKPATPDELKAFATVLESLVWLPAGTATKAK